jgi:1-acyl-sn-glycerol-3-phosphate acyltransferase
VPKLRPRPGVRLGRALDFSRYEGLAGDRFVERSMTDEIMYELMQMSGQEYVDRYAGDVKAEQAALTPGVTARLRRKSS